MNSSVNSPIGTLFDLVSSVCSQSVRIGLCDVTLDCSHDQLNAWCNWVDWSVQFISCNTQCESSSSPGSPGQRTVKRARVRVQCESTVALLHCALHEMFCSVLFFSCPRSVAYVHLDMNVWNELNWTDQSIQLPYMKRWVDHANSPTSRHIDLAYFWQICYRHIRLHSILMELFTLEFTFASNSSCDVNEA